MANSKKQRPSLFCEWVVGTTIESALGPIPKRPKKPKKRDVVRVEVTTDDESEEDTIKITYPRTGRNTPPPQEAKTIVKRVRFEDTPKSALKKSPTPLEASEEASDSGSEPESDSSQSDNASSSDASDSDAENSDSAPSPKKKKKKKAKQKPVTDDAESDWDSDPDPTCECRRCTKGREILRRIGKKQSKDSTSPSTEPSDSEPEEPPKPKKKECGKEKKGGKKAKEPEPETDTESAEETSESEPESPPKKQQPKKEQPKKQGKKNTKVEESTRGGETSESEAESPKPKKKKGSPKSDAKEDETPEESETDAEPSDSANETEAESEPEPEPKKKQKQKNKGKAKADSPKNEDEKGDKQEQKGNKQKNKGKQKAGKQAKKTPEQPEDKAEDEEAVEAPNQENQGKYKKAKGNRTKEGDKENAAPQGMVLKNSRHQDGFLWGGYPQGLLLPHPHHPRLIEPIHAQVVQTPSGPVPNAYYDPENNVMRQHQGPPTGNNHGYLHPAHNAFSGTPPPGMPPVPQTPFYYGFNQPQPQPGYGQYPPYHQYYHPMLPQEGYAHVPITQGMPGHAWPTVSGPQGFPPALPMGHGVQVNPQVMGGTENAALPPSKDKDKTSQNNVMPPGLTGQNNPYLPQRAGSVFKNYGSHGARTASKGDGSARAGSNNWNNNVTTWNDGNGNNQQNSQTDWNPVPDHSQNGSGQNDNTWGRDQNQNQDQNGNGNNGWDAGSGKQEDNGQKWASESNGSNGTVRKKRDDHWGNDTHLGGNITWEEQKDTVPSTTGPAADNNVVGWDVVTDRVVEVVSPDSRKSDKGKSDKGHDEDKPDNVMPGSWVETPGGVPAWGDVNAAVDTQGGIVW